VTSRASATRCRRARYIGPDGQTIHQGGSMDATNGAPARDGPGERKPGEWGDAPVETHAHAGPKPGLGQKLGRMPNSLAAHRQADGRGLHQHRRTEQCGVPPACERESPAQVRKGSEVIASGRLSRYLRKPGPWGHDEASDYRYRRLAARAWNKAHLGAGRLGAGVTGQKRTTSQSGRSWQ